MMNDEQLLREIDHGKMLLTTNDFMGTRLVDPLRGAIACFRNVLKTLEEKLKERDK